MAISRSGARAKERHKARISVKKAKQRGESVSRSQAMKEANKKAKKKSGGVSRSGSRAKARHEERIAVKNIRRTVIGKPLTKKYSDIQGDTQQKIAGIQAKYNVKRYAQAGAQQTAALGGSLMDRVKSKVVQSLKPTPVQPRPSILDRVKQKISGSLKGTMEGPKVGVKEVAREIPGTIVSGAKKAGEIGRSLIQAPITAGFRGAQVLGEGLAYGTSPLVREQYKKGNLNILPNVSKTEPAQMFGAAAETALMGLPMGAATKTTRLARGLATGAGYGVTSALQQNRLPTAGEVATGAALGGAIDVALGPELTKVNKDLRQLKELIEDPYAKKIVDKYEYKVNESVQIHGKPQMVPIPESLKKEIVKVKQKFIPESETFKFIREPKVGLTITAVNERKPPVGSFSTLFDKRARLEISDKGIKLKPEFENAIKKGNGFFTLDEIIDHPTLFKRAPYLKKSKVNVFSGNLGEYKGAITSEPFRGGDRYRIDLNTNRIKIGDEKRVLFHEIQHIIQEKEGFARGGDFSEFMPKKIGETAAYKKYISKAGEVEARSTAKRIGLTKKQLIENPPYAKEGIPLRDMIVDMKGKKTFMPKDISKSPLVEEAGKVSGLPKGNEWIAGADEKLESFYKGGKPRGFLKTVAKSEETAPALSRAVKAKESYKQLDLGELEKKAVERVKNIDEAKSYVMNLTKPELVKSGGAEEAATAIQVMKKLQASGKYQEAADIADIVATRMTEAGQLSNVAKLYDNLSPEGVVIQAKKAIKKANTEKWFWQKEFKLDEETAKQLGELAKARQEAVDPVLKKELSSQLGELLNRFNHASIGQKISLAQTEAQLLNPKTHIRNIIGNEIMYRVERVNKYLATPIDWTRSKLTGGKRTITFHKNQGEYWKNFLTGAKEAWRGNRLEATQFDIPKQTFKSKWNPLTWGEKVLSASLQGFDHAAFMRAKNGTIGELAWLRAKSEGLTGQVLKEAVEKYSQNADANILKIAEDYGKYVTFQDENIISKGFISIKRGLNVGQDFGIGDLALKYPKTPGALLMRGIEYSPAGFLRSAYEIAYPILRGKPANSREATLALSRAITGTIGLSGLGYYLADKGIITGRPSKDKDVRATEKSQGLGAYKINVSALKRWVMSGFNDKEAKLREGDTMFTYDWAQPLAMSVAMGANLSENLKEKGRAGALDIAATGLESVTSSAQTLAEQPLVSGLTRLFGYGDVVGGITETIKGLPSSFTPSIANQINQLMDNTSRETYDPSYLNEAKNLVKARLPFLAQTLPEKIGTDGKPLERYQNAGNSIIQVMLDPGFVTQFESTPESKMVLDLFETTGETTQFPRVVKKTVQDENGNTINLTPEQYTNLQKYVGEKTKEAFTKLAESPEFQSMSDTDKVNRLTSILTAIGADAKRDVLGIGKGSGISDDAFMKYTQDLKSLSDEDFKKRISELKGGSDEDKNMAEQIMKFRRDDVAKDIGLDFQKKWSEISQEDKGNVLENHMKWLGDKEKVEFFKTMLDKDFLTDPQIKEVAKRGVLKPDDILKADVASGVKAMVLYETLKAETGDFFKDSETKDVDLAELNDKTAERLQNAIKSLDMSPREKQSQYDAIVQGLKDYRVDDKARIENLISGEERWSQMNVNDRAEQLVRYFTGMDKSQAEERFTRLEEKGLISDSVKEEFKYRWKKAKEENAEKTIAEGDEYNRQADEAMALIEKRDRGETLTPEEEQKIQLALEASPLNLEAPGATLASVNIGAGAGVGNNNPLNIKIGGATQHWIDEGLATPGTMGRDGGQFIRFNSPEIGMEAAKELLFGDVYSGLTVEQAARKWSNQGYGAEATGVSGTKKMSSLTEDEKDTMVKAMAWRESKTTIGNQIASNPPVLNQPQVTLLRSMATGKTTEQQATEKVLTEFNKGADAETQKTAKIISLDPPEVKYSNIGYIPPEYYNQVSRIYGLIASLQVIRERWTGTAPTLI